MKRKQLLTKTFLIAAMLIMGMSAWSAVTWDFTNSTIWGTVSLPSAGNSYADVSYNANGETATTGNIITIHSTTGKIIHASTQTNGFAFDSEGSTSDNYIKMSVPAGSTVTVLGAFSGNRTLQVSFNGSTTTISANWTDASQDFVNETNTALDLYIYCNQNHGGSSQVPYLKSISLKQTVPVTINYRDKDDQDKTLVSSTVVNAEVGTSYTPIYTSPLYVSNSDPYEYTYYSGADAKTINEATTFNVLYSKSDRAEYTYIVNAIKNDDKAVIEQLASGTLYKGAGVAVPYQANYNINGTLYTRGTTNSQFRQTVTPTKTDYVQTFPYVAQSTNNIIYLTEAEDIEGATKNTTSTNVEIRASNAAAASIPSGGVNICTLPAGTYKLYAAMHHTRNNAVVTTTYGYGNTEFTIQTSGTNRLSESNYEFTLTETSTLVCKSISGDGLLDNLYITGTLPVPTFTVGSYNYEHDGYAITPNSYAIDGGTLTYTVDGGAATTCTAGETFYAADGVLVITWSKDNYTSMSSEPVTLNSAPSSASPETLISFQTSDDNIEKNVTHAYKSVTIEGGSIAGIGIDSNKGKLKLRTNQNNNTITLNVNSGYKVTGVSITANSNNSGSGATIGLASVSVDGGSNIMTGTKTFPISTATAEQYSTGTISAINSIVLTFDNSNITDDNNKNNAQIIAGIEVTYMTPAEVEVANAIAACKTYETSSEFATYIDGGTYTSAAEVYAAHSAWQIAQAKANGSTDYSKAILNRTFELHNTSGWTIYGDARSDADTDKDKYGEVEYGDDWSQYYTGYNGRNVSQNIASLPAGVYRLTSYVYSWGDNNTGATVRLFANGSVSDNQGGTNEFSTTFDFAVTGNEESIKIGIGGVGQGSGDNTWGAWGYRVKNFTLTKISESMTISSVGWATYCSPYALDFSNTGTTVYTAALNTTTNNISLSEVSGGKVPANTGVILYKDGGGDINPAVIASANPIENNELVGIVEDTQVAYNPSDGVYNYIMEWDSENSKPMFSKAAANGATLRANKAYLSTAYNVETGPARALAVASDAIETTGINNVQNSGIKAQGYYNLNGQRVSSPTKGLYIVNGRKVVVK